jgi:hypothetical protein
MDYKTFATQVMNCLARLLDGVIVGTECVSTIDNLMADDLPDEVPGDLQQILDQMHEDFAFYVDDETERKESSAYFGLMELRKKAALYLDLLQTEMQKLSKHSI